MEEMTLKITWLRAGTHLLEFFTQLIRWTGAI